LIDCGLGRWQIAGGAYLVNCWPQTKNGFTYHIAGTVGSHQGKPSQAVLAALAGGSGTGHASSHTGHGYYRSVKTQLLKSDPHCWICKCGLTRKTATIDHVIPLDKGGSNGQDNLRIACESCNKTKGNKIVAFKK
jgi:hypothetical protein